MSGSGFFPNEAISLYWDQPNRVSGGTNADANGNFTAKVKPFPGDAPGGHRLFASAPPSPCANFTLQAPTPTPSPEPSPSPDPTPSSTPIGAATPARVPSNLGGLEVILKPPFVFLPLIGGAGIVLALAYWVLSLAMRPRPQVLKSVTVGHLASRPDYTASFGTPPPAPAPASPLPSAWPDLPPAAPVAEMAGPVPPIESLGSGEEFTGQNDPLLAAWADVLPPASSPTYDAAAETTEPVPPHHPPAAPGTSPAAGEATLPDEPLDFPEPGD